MSHHKQIRHDLCYRPLLACATLALILIGQALGQTSQFTYHGRLTDADNPAQGLYDFQFKLFDSADFVTGTQQGLTINLSSVQVANGVFTVELDFGAGVFTGAARFLEIGIRPAGSPDTFNVLGPRQPVTATPYAVRSATAAAADTATNAANATNATNAAQLGGMAASQYVVTTDARLSDARPPTPDSTDYVQNTTNQQSATNFNISGTGAANIFQAASQFNIGAARVLSIGGTNNLFAGENAGSNNSIGSNNTFFGKNAGEANSSGSFNSIFGSFASGGNGSQNTAVGYLAVTGNGTNSTAIGARSIATADNSIVLGSIAGLNGATSSARVGIGTPSPQGGLEVVRNWDGLDGNIVLRGDGPTITFYNPALPTQSRWILHHAGFDGSLNFHIGTPLNWGLPKLSIHPGGAVYLNDLGGPGGTPLCRNGAGYIGACSSSLRYKKDVAPYLGGLDVAMLLRPVSYTWKGDGREDVGFAAEEVEQVEPRLTFKNKDGEVEGVNYGNITAVLVNSIKEQQMQIDVQKEEIKKQQQQINALKRFICTDHPEAEVCKAK
jgi:hypothetical protein